jgi:hypothetical protein
VVRDPWSAGSRFAGSRFAGSRVRDSQGQSSNGVDFAATGKRPAFATHPRRYCFKSGALPQLVQQRLGLRNVAATMTIYAHVLPSMQ